MILSLFVPIFFTKESQDFSAVNGRSRENPPRAPAIGAAGRKQKTREAQKAPAGFHSQSLVDHQSSAVNRHQHKNSFKGP
jgi:hypothetical protein